MKRFLVLAALGVGLAVMGTAQASEDLAKSAGCMNCHNVTGKKMGPGLKDVSAKFKDPAEQAKLVDKLASGKGHPGVKAKPEELKKIAAWIGS